jgi:TRAP-type uncharacterized transport system substrate-binding protein
MAVRDQAQASRRYLVITVIAAVALTAAAMWLAFALLRPTPPGTVTMATGPEGGTSAELGQRYRELLAGNGIDLRLVPLAGAVEGVARLRDPQSGISVAIIPSGITNRQQSPGLVSLGTLFYAPLWLFYRGVQEQKHESLLGKRISIGPEGSASHALGLELLARVGVFGKRNATLLALTPQVSAEKLLHGEIDGLVLLEAWETPLLRQLLSAQDIELASIPRADAFVALYPFLSKVTLPAGVGDMAKNRPPSDVVLLAPKASLVVRSDLNPAIQYLLLEAAAQIHSGPGIFHKAGQFPAAESVDLPLSKNALQFYKTGPPFLQRNLPFWLAVLVQQVLIVLIPVFAVLYPLLRFAPALYDWAMQRRFFSLYAELKLIEDEVASGCAPKDGPGDLSARLDRLEERTGRARLPESFRPQLHALRFHITLARQRLERR